MNCCHTPIATNKEVFDAYENFPPDEKGALFAKAEYLVNGTNYGSAEDLYHQAVLSALDGTRPWPLDVTYGAYMNMAMRSIANKSRKSHDQSRRVSFEDNSTFDETIGESGKPVVSQLTMLGVKQRAEAAVRIARRKLSGAEDALAVLDGMVLGLKPCDAKSVLGMRALAYDAARKRVERVFAEIKAMAEAPF